MNAQFQQLQQQQQQLSGPPSVRSETSTTTDPSTGDVNTQQQLEKAAQIAAVQQLQMQVVNPNINTTINPNINTTPIPGSGTVTPNGTQFTQQMIDLHAANNQGNMMKGYEIPQASKGVGMVHTRGGNYIMNMNHMNQQHHHSNKGGYHGGKYGGGKYGGDYYGGDYYGNGGGHKGGLGNKKGKWYGKSGHKGPHPHQAHAGKVFVGNLP